MNVVSYKQDTWRCLKMLLLLQECYSTILKTQMSIMDWEETWCASLCNNDWHTISVTPVNLFRQGCAQRCKCAIYVHWFIDDGRQLFLLSLIWPTSLLWDLSWSSSHVLWRLSSDWGMCAQSKAEWKGGEAGGGRVGTNILLFNGLLAYIFKTMPFYIIFKLSLF